MKKSVRILSIRPELARLSQLQLGRGSGLTGLSLKVSGRLHKQRIVPKQTVKRTNKGPSAASSMMAVQTGTFTGKNKKGSYSIKVQTGHSLRNKL